MCQRDTSERERERTGEVVALGLLVLVDCIVEADRSLADEIPMVPHIHSRLLKARMIKASVVRSC